MSLAQTSPMLHATVGVVMAMLILALFLAFIRLASGPSLPDRVVALDLMSTIVVSIMATYAIETGKAVALDVAIVVALVTFLATVAFARYIEKGALVTQEPDHD